MYRTPLVLDTGSGYSIIRRDTLPPDWKRFDIAAHLKPVIGDANCTPIPIASVFKLRIRLNDALYRALFFVVDTLYCQIILGTQFTNKYCQAMLCQRKQVLLENGT